MHVLLRSERVRFKFFMYIISKILIIIWYYPKYVACNPGVNPGVPSMTVNIPLMTYIIPSYPEFQDGDHIGR
jgi:hypothetical protein